MWSVVDEPVEFVLGALGHVVVRMAGVVAAFVGGVVTAWLLGAEVLSPMMFMAMTPFFWLGSPVVLVADAVSVVLTGDQLY